MISRCSSQHKGLLLFSFLSFVLVFFLAACGSGVSTSSANSLSREAPASQKNSANTGNIGGASQQSSNHVADTSKNTDVSTQSTGPSYLIKTLKVTMEVQDTRQAASTIAAWMSSADPRSTSAGANVTQSADANSYEVTLTYEVQATRYPDIYNYLRDYNLQKGGHSHLVSFNETVQNVTNDYVDTQSRIKNYKGEQARLLTFLSQAKNIGEVLSIETKLTEVEGSIETSEAHLNSLANQVTYYTVTIDLQPFLPLSTPQVTKDPGWSFAQVVGSAFSSSLEFGRNLLTFLIWIVAFAIYIVPVLIIIFLIRKYHSHILLWFEHLWPASIPPQTK